MPSHDSLWIDEAHTWTYAAQPDIGSALSKFKSDTYSEAQMPLGMVAAWAGAQVLGKSEWQMRAQNMFWITAALLCFFRIGKLVSIPFLPLLLAIQPFTWYYANEFRPYSLQIFSGSLICLGLISLTVRGAQSKEWSIALTGGILISCSASMLGVIPSMAAVVVAARFFASRKQGIGALALVLCLLSIMLLAPLGFYYLSSLMRGAGGAKIWALGPANLLGAVVEVFGFSGLLPARQTLRDLARDGVFIPNLTPFFFPIAGGFILFGCMAYLLYRFLVADRCPPAWWSTCAVYFILSLAGLIILALGAHFPFWGRHLSPVFPAYVLGLGLLVFEAWKTRRTTPRSAAIVCCGLLFSSSLTLRLSPAYSKDDYRSAAGSALDVISTGGIAWWAADAAAANYYGLFPGHAGEPGPAYSSYSKDKDYLGKLPAPDVIILSKPDIYDPGSFVRTWISVNKFELTSSYTAFTVWRRPSPLQQQ